jgi:type I restriction enzyme R subunit
VSNEADTCRRYVVPKLHASGWADDRISEQRYFTDGRIVPVGRRHRRKPGKKVDYLLFYRQDFPIAIVEAKADYKLPSDGLQQAMTYAEILDLRFAYSTNGLGIVEHDFTTGRQRDLDGFPTPDELWERLRGTIAPHDAKSAQDLLVPFNRELRNPDGSVKRPRYFQEIAIRRGVQAVIRGQRRILITMATGTGKSFVAAQFIWKLWKSGRKRRILYLVDRNILVDQPLAREFAMFGDAVWKIQGEAKKGREIYFALYQALAGDEGRPGLYREYPKDYFDLIVVDECHRGSAKDESRWREILEHFEPATQIGMTATPLRRDNADTYRYFGDPIYTYTLARGIDDGFLAPYRVHRVVPSVDATGFRPETGQLDRNGQAIPDGVYGTKDFEKSLSLPSRTRAVANHLTNYLKRTDRFDKTIVFCVDQEHADQMRQALHDANADLTREYPRYVARVTADEGAEGRARLDEFQDPERRTPVILTTSQLLSTGVDIPDLRNVVLFKPVESMIDFKQIIGRGTRLLPDKDKLFFTILDYTGATRLFADPEFDGEPEVAREEKIDDTGTTVCEPGDPYGEKPDSEKEDLPPITVDGDAPRPRRKLYVDGVPVEITVEGVWQLDANGKRIKLTSYIEYSSEQLRAVLRTPAELRSRWASEKEREAIMAAIEERGISVEDLAEAVGQPEADPLDLLVHVAWNAPLRTRRERAEGILTANQRVFEKYTPAARQVLQDLLAKYAEHGPSQLHDLGVLEVEPLSRHGSPVEIAALFGGPDSLRLAVSELEQTIYAA